MSSLPDRHQRLAKERSRSRNASLTSELLKTFTGVTGSGQKNGPIPSRRSMRSCLSRSWKRKSQITCANHRRLRIIGNGPLRLTSYKLKWIVWRSTLSNPRCYTSSLQRSGTIPLLLASA